MHVHGRLKSRHVYRDGGTPRGLASGVKWISSHRAYWRLVINPGVFCRLASGLASGVKWFSSHRAYWRLVIIPSLDTECLQVDSLVVQFVNLLWCFSFSLGALSFQPSTLSVCRFTRRYWFS
jgi:hypothetical protein